MRSKQISLEELTRKVVVIQRAWKRVMKSLIIKESVGLKTNQIKVSRFFRCNANTNTVSSSESCAEDDVVSSYIEIEITDTYTPLWTEFGVGEPVTFDVERTVQLS